MHDTSRHSIHVSITNFHNSGKPLVKSQEEIIYLYWDLIAYPHCQTNPESWHSWTTERERMAFDLLHGRWDLVMYC